MTIAFLSKDEIIRELGLPPKVGRQKWNMWEADPTFPKPEPGTGGRYCLQLIEKWLRVHLGVDTTEIIPVSDGKENFHGLRERRARKAAKTKGPGNAGPQIPPAEGRMGSAVVTPLRPSGARLPKDDVSPMVEHRPNSA
jgi:hypothetical protein